MEQSEFKFLTDFIKSKSGISIKEDKLYLLEARLMPIAKQNNLVSLEQLAAKLKTSNDTKFINEVIDAMTTNESLFFRDNKPFDYLKEEILPNITTTGKKIRIWCAACSTGQEPYSIVMTFEENKQLLNNSEYEIIATDISDSALEKAQKGEYTQFEVQRGLPITILLKYFTQNNDKWLIKDDYKKNIKFKKFNLMESYSAFGNFDVVFCRNVLIYFEQETKKDILKRIANTLTNPGYLLLGAGETIMGISDDFKNHPSKSGLYIKK